MPKIAKPAAKSSAPAKDTAKAAASKAAAKKTATSPAKKTGASSANKPGQQAAAKKIPPAKVPPKKPEAKKADASRQPQAAPPASTPANKEQKQRKLPRIGVGVGKRRVVVSYKNLSPDLQELLRLKYPTGWNDYVIKVNKSETDFFHAVMLETDETSYLVKVDVKIDTHPKDDDDILDSVISHVVDTGDDVIAAHNDVDDDAIVGDSSRGGNADDDDGLS